MQPTRLFDIMDRQAQEQPAAVCLGAKIAGDWQTFSYAQVAQTSRELGIGLLNLGLAKGERVALIANNRPEWVYTDLALSQLGCPTVPIYPTATVTDCECILAHSEARYLFVSSAAIYTKIQSIRAQLPMLKEIYSFEHIPGVRHWSELTDSGSKATAEQLKAHAKTRSEVTADDLASVIYTSGTTGKPKGVMLSHHNFLANILAIDSIMNSPKFAKALSFLPLSHVLERVGIYFYQLNGISIYFAESMDTVAKNLAEVRPNVFVCVPRVLEKLYDVIVAKGRELTGAKKALFDWALILALHYDPAAWHSPLAACKLGIARKLIFSKWRAAVGGNIDLIIVGGSALQPRLGRVFWGAGLKVIEGYGLTETSPVISFNTPTDVRIGTVGKVLPNLQVKIQPEEGYRANEGEILVKGPSVMAGYYKNAEATLEAIDHEGFFHTGDIGMIEDGFLRITDRKKEMFKTSGGKYVAPLAVENKFRESPYISQLIVIGDNRKFPSAIIVPEFTHLEQWAVQAGIKASSPQALLQVAAVKELFEVEVARLNQSFGRWEQIKKFLLVTDEWAVHTGELTPKLSLKRKVIEAKYQALVNDLYDHLDTDHVQPGH